MGTEGQQRKGQVGRCSQEEDLLVGDKGKISTGEHAGRKMTHEGLGLDVKIAQHFIGAPAAEKANAVGVNVGTEECHGTGSTQGACRDVLGEETVGRTKDLN